MANITSWTKEELQNFSNKLNLPPRYTVNLDDGSYYQILLQPVSFQWSVPFMTYLCSNLIYSGNTFLGSNSTGNLEGFLNPLDPNRMLGLVDPGGSYCVFTENTVLQYYQNMPWRGNWSAKLYWDNWNSLGLICTGVHTWRAWGNATNVGASNHLITPENAMTGNIGNVDFLTGAMDYTNLSKYRYVTGQYRCYDNDSNNPCYIHFKLRQIHYSKTGEKVQKYYALI